MKESDKAIKLAKEMAEEYKFKSNPNRKYPCFDSEEKRIKCQKRGEQYEQLAEWLKDYKRLRMVTSQSKEGYILAREIYTNIERDENHEISIEDMIRVVSFWGFNEESAKDNTIGFVCSCARDKIKKIFETALVYGDFTLYEKLVSLISDKSIITRQKVRNK